MSCRCELVEFTGCLETLEAVATVAAMAVLYLDISLPSPLSHHMHQLDETQHRLSELYSVQGYNHLYRETTTCTVRQPLVYGDNHLYCKITTCTGNQFSLVTVFIAEAVIST